MSDEENQEIQSQETPATQATQEPQKSDKEINFDKIRKKMEAMEEENQKLREQVTQQSEVVNRFQSAFQPQTPEIDDYQSLEADDFVSKKHVENTTKRTLEELDGIKKDLQEQRKYYEMLRLEAKFPDYNEVVNNDSIKQLEQEDPDYAEMLSQLSSDYTRREKAYKRIKKMQKEKLSAKETVQNNQKKNYHYTPYGQSFPYNDGTVDFDVSNPAARTEAYAKLRAAQKRGF